MQLLLYFLTVLHPFEEAHLNQYQAEKQQKSIIENSHQKNRGRQHMPYV
jgi:hypothetical protein